MVSYSHVGRFGLTGSSLSSYMGRTFQKADDPDKRRHQVVAIVWLEMQKEWGFATRIVNESAGQPCIIIPASDCLKVAEWQPVK